MKNEEVQIDTSISMRILVTLRILIEEPDTYTKAMLAEKIGVSRDSIKKYFLAMRRAGFIVKVAPYPDYTYSIEVISDLRQEDATTKYSSARHKKIAPTKP
jgi:response regulator of citrate/malate metabolism